MSTSDKIAGIIARLTLVLFVDLVIGWIIAVVAFLILEAFTWGPLGAQADFPLGVPPSPQISTHQPPSPLPLVPAHRPRCCA